MRATRDLDLTHPALADLRRRGRRRMPRFVREYLESGTGADRALAANRAALDRIRLLPRGLCGEVATELGTELLGRRWSAPFGVAPVGLSGLIWPGAERKLARTATAAGIPYCLSTVAAAAPEDVAPDLGGNGWFQLYPPREPRIRDAILDRAAAAGFEVLVLTIDVPVMSRRERQRRAGITMPPRLTPAILAQIAACPAWALGILRHGRPRLRLLEPYTASGGATVQRADHAIRTAPDPRYLEALRRRWRGPLVVKGVLDPALARQLREAGADAIWVSNHGGRQFDAAPAAIDALAPIREAVGPEMPLILDGGIESGTDILRAIACGADFVMLGRAWHWALAAFDEAGARHLVHILREQLRADLAQLGIARPVEARRRLWSRRASARSA